jgi:hypothetical protein
MPEFSATSPRQLVRAVTPQAFGRFRCCQSGRLRPRNAGHAGSLRISASDGAEQFGLGIIRLHSILHSPGASEAYALCQSVIGTHADSRRDRDQCVPAESPLSSPTDTVWARWSVSSNGSDAKQIIDARNVPRALRSHHGSSAAPEVQASPHAEFSLFQTSRGRTPDTHQLMRVGLRCGCVPCPRCNTVP